MTDADGAERRASRMTDSEGTGSPVPKNGVLK